MPWEELEAAGYIVSTAERLINAGVQLAFFLPCFLAALRISLRLLLRLNTVKQLGKEFVLVYNPQVTLLQRS